MDKKRVRNRLKPWVISFLLLGPVIGIYVSHYAHAAFDPNLKATGFIAYDMAYYMANAREHFDSGRFTLTYGNPFSPFKETPRIYFQPMALILGFIWFVTGLDPGLIFVSFGFISALMCVRVSIALYEHLFGLDSLPSKLGLICFVWGGGVMAISGGLYGILTGKGLEALFRFDPHGGWWFLNYGRNLVFPTEALYHFLVFTCMLFFFRCRFRPALLMLFVLSISHPFTGIQFILIVLAWSCLEYFYFKSKYISMESVVISSILLIFHVLYYLIYLPMSMEHASLMSQWTSMWWVMKAETMATAYTIVLMLALWRVRRPVWVTEVFATPQNRLLLTWFFMSFLLSNHEFVLDPIQPLHFAHGYIWIPLFLLGAPVLIDLIGRFRFTGSPGIVKYFIPLLLCVMISDNTAWFFYQFRKPTGMYMTPASQELMNWLRAQPESDRDSLLVSDNPMISYLAMVYTPMRSWYSHWKCTPFVESKENDVRSYFRNGDEPSLWSYWDLVVVKKVSVAPTQPGNPSSFRMIPEVFRNDGFQVAVKPARRQMKEMQCFPENRFSTGKGQ